MIKYQHISADVYESGSPIDPRDNVETYYTMAPISFEDYLALDPDIVESEEVREHVYRITEKNGTVYYLILIENRYTVDDVMYYTEKSRAAIYNHAKRLGRLPTVEEALAVRGGRPRKY